MNVYIWQLGEGLTGNWHSGGGLVVVAESEKRARELVLDWNKQQSWGLDKVLEDSPALTGEEGDEHVGVD